MIPEWCKRAAEEIRALTVGKQILAKWDAEWNERLAAIIAKHAPEEGIPISERVHKNKAFIAIENALNGNDNLLACGYTPEQIDGLVQRVKSHEEQVRELVEAARNKLRNPGDLDGSLRLRRALEPFKGVS